MAARNYLAFDLGASSGRAILGTLDGGRLAIRELTRFDNPIIELVGHLHWDVAHLYQCVKAGMRACAIEAGVRPESVGVDTWGVDCALLAADGSLVSLPYSYRDLRTQGAPEEFFRKVPAARVYELTGIQVMPINTLFQLYVVARDRWPLLPAADALLMMPDLMNYFLTGVKRTEFTIATTTQLYNPRRGDWEPELLEAVGLPRSLMQQVVPPGTRIGELRAPIAQEVGLDNLPVLATASHDTAAAVAAAPAEGNDWAYVSSGTWSLVGIESRTPIITEQARKANLTNEGGVEGTFRVLKNVSGLWLVQECRRAWARDRDYSYAELASMATEGQAFRSLVDPDWEGFMAPPDMPAAIQAFCERAGQPAPETPAQFVRCVLESLALKYRVVLDQLRRVSPTPINRLHIIGGGSQNQALSQFAASATGLPVVCGPMEATAIGNLLVQAMGMEELASLAELRAVVRASFPLREYEPQDAQAWDAAYDRFLELLQSLS